MAFKGAFGAIECGTIKIPVSNPELYRGTEIEMWHGQVVLRIVGYETQTEFKARCGLDWEWHSIHVGGAEDSQQVVVFTSYITHESVRNELLPKLKNYFLNKSSVKFQVQEMLPEGWDYERVDKWIWM